MRKAISVLLLMSISHFPLYADDIAELVIICEACHGKNGQSIQPSIPNLAGQKSIYMAREMKSIRDGIRQNSQMEGVIKNLTDQQIDELAQHYSRLPAVSNKSTFFNKLGQNTQAFCISCHGMTGITVNEQWPNLAGQQKEYLQNQLKAFRSNTRIGHYMKVIAKELSDEQLEAVSEFYSQLSGTPSEK